jgi:hypothetical protein
MSQATSDEGIGMNELNDLETLARESHQKGLSWKAFWRVAAERVQQCEPDNLLRYRMFVDRLKDVALAGSDRRCPETSKHRISKVS